MTDLERARAIIDALSWTPNAGRRTFAVLVDALAAARREGAEEMRERAADQAHLVWGDGQIAASIRALPLTPEEPK